MDGSDPPVSPASVVWTERALTLLAAIHTSVAAASPVYATRVVDRVLARVNDVATFPESGRQIPEYAAVALREVLEGPYRILYRYRPDAHRIEVLAVVHGRQLLPPRL